MQELTKSATLEQERADPILLPLLDVRKPVKPLVPDH